MSSKNGRRFLLVNTGSSSVKLTVWADGKPARTMRTARAGEPVVDVAALTAPFSPIDAVVHRVVHAGDVQRHALVTPAVERAITDAAALAPLHNPIALRYIARARTAFGASVPNIAAVDTAFFADLPAHASSYALSHEAGNARRFGFHGLAHASMSRRVRELDDRRPRRVATLQLGAGCSATAILDGKAIDTSMGFSPSEGLMMATRAGDVDPGLLIELVRHGASADDLDRLINKEGGLFGVCGHADMQEVLALADTGEPRAVLALALYCYRITKIVGAYAAVLGGVDAIVFGGGVGENAHEVRRRVLEPLSWLGVQLDPARDDRPFIDAPMTTATSAVRAWVVHVDEAAEMARIGDALLDVERGRAHVDAARPSV